MVMNATRCKTRAVLRSATFEAFWSTRPRARTLAALALDRLEGVFGCAE
jgi:hypothetical protein